MTGVQTCALPIYEIVVPRIYFVRDSEQDRQAVCAQDLVDRLTENGRRAVHLPTFDSIVDHVAANAMPGDLVMTMGAGDVWKVAHDLVQRLV